MSLTIVGTPEWRSDVELMTGAVLAAPYASVGVVSNCPVSEYAIPVERPTATAAVFSGSAYGTRGVRGGVACAGASMPTTRQSRVSPESLGVLRFRAMQAAAVGMLAIVSCAAIMVGWQLVQVFTAIL
ncbi:MAG: hypothetical protein LBM94_07345 [Propionibacteriaceae bacterium]|jgi:hypothetical protein|nr:hypothetical protein [Propionibacteriaceae bacterium]